ncbi:Trs33p SCDLUD_002894 [Saccharomycodes ludwigii]|uniref:Trs33p n=1 Tax=Saccharomycodes ludwigii TaxID=36035 RepID=UPI001E878272|nr:hypothetical protein SCDLUD_002894 [Saccharomycodes ludwigii]KAH3901402.1 hypothetical protein SCDLUD_002894 [Saccharomycodes ludwigii]
MSNNTHPQTANRSSALPTVNTQQQRLQYEQQLRQYEIYKKSLPTVNTISYEYLMNEMVPLAISLEIEEGQDINTSHSTKMAQSHQLIYQYCKLTLPQQQSILNRIHQIGFGIGSRISEMLIFQNNPNLNFKSLLSSDGRNNNNGAELLPVMKFICKDVWKLVFGKQVDNLKTNHRGTFYLLDKNYCLIRNFVVEKNSKFVEDSDDNLERHVILKPYLEIAAGVIKGVLSNLINIDTDAMTCVYEFVDNGVSFNVHVPKS